MWGVSQYRVQKCNPAQAPILDSNVKTPLTAKKMPWSPSLLFLSVPQACDHLRDALMTAPPERLRLLLPPPFRSPHLSCWILLRPAGFVVTLEARDPLVWDQVAAHLALDHGAHCQSCGSALCPGGSEVMLLSSSRSAHFLANVACRSFFFHGACPVLSPLCGAHPEFCFLPSLSGPWGKPAGCARQGGPCGACKWPWQPPAGSI